MAEWLDWIIEHFSEIWEILLALAGIALYLVKKSNAGLLADVWKDVKAEVWERAEGALLEVDAADVAAIAGPFWDNYLAGIKVLRFFINKERFLAWCWAQWQKFIDTIDEVDTSVARRAYAGSRAFSV